jgi:hypothetical protein
MEACRQRVLEERYTESHSRHNSIGPCLCLSEGRVPVTLEHRREGPLLIPKGGLRGLRGRRGALQLICAATLAPGAQVRLVQLLGERRGLRR